MRTLPELSDWWHPDKMSTFEYKTLPWLYKVSSQTPVGYLPKFEYTTTINGYPMSNLGLHGVPYGHHGGWASAQRWPEWEERLPAAGIRSMVIINDGDSIKQLHDGVTAVDRLLSVGVYPIIREAMKFSRGFMSGDIVKWASEVYARYGLKPIVIAGNEPLDPREWPNNSRPPRDEALEIIGRDLVNAAKIIIDNGGTFALPDGPSWSMNPLRWFVDDRWIFDEGLGVGTVHNYCKGRHRNYPYDEATKGKLLTVEEYKKALDDFWLQRNWMEEWVQLRNADGEPMWNVDGTPMCDEPLTIALSLEKINLARSRGANQIRNAVGDDVCWRAFERWIAYSVDIWDYVIPLIATETGWVPRDRPGSTQLDIDVRMPYTTLNAIARRTLAVLNDWSPFAMINFWLGGDDSMVTAGSVGFRDAAYVGGDWIPPYEYEKPVYKALRKRNCQIDPSTHILAALGKLNGIEVQLDLATEKLTSL